MVAKLFIVSMLVICSNAFVWAQDKQLETKLRQNADDAFNEVAKNQLTLRFFNALNGKGISGATVTIENLEGKYISDNEGAVSFPFPADDGVYTVSFRAPKYVPSEFPIEIMAGTIFFNRFSVSPQLDIKHLRVVLDWDDAPKDLDAHFVKEGAYHISFRDMRTLADGKGQLDRDDMDAYGPETITLTEISSKGMYEYFVHDYTNQRNTSSKALSASKATVKVFGEGKLLNVFQIPQGKKGTVWKVFSIRNGGVVEVNTIREK
jgi:hypothetical protein